VDRWALSEGQFTAVPAGPGAALSVRYPVRRGTEGSATAGLSYALGTKWQIRAAYGSTFRLPTLNELYRPFTVFPVRTEANAALAHERNRSFEIGLDYAPAPWASLSVSAYRARLSGAIANVTIATNLRQRRNLPAIRSTGFEAELHLTGETVSLDGFVAVADARVEGGGIAPVLDGKRPAQTAAVTASASLSWRPAPGWQFTGSLRHTGAQFEDDLGKDRLPPATTLDLFGEVPLTPGAALVVRAENMTGARTVTRNQGGSIDLGVPRTIWLGARIKVR
jgi:outer membrane receptor protein involved in Fe transport